MCGIVGIISDREDVDRDLVTRMRDSMLHRGPDEAGLWIADDRTVGLGHRRLSIVDLDAGHQPMWSSRGDVVIVYNGEVYNHVSLREELERRGHRFRTRCDTEVVLASYLEYGDACIERLDGMFAFLIYDVRSRRLFFARDRFGKKPLYYARITNGWVFASEIKALLVHPQLIPAVNRHALRHYLSFLTTPAPQTLFEGISKLPAAHCGSWCERDGLQTRRWWRLPSDKVDVSLADAATDVRELFTAAVRKRMMSDVPFGVYLSGGIDSTSNVAAMSQMMSQPVNTFSIAFADEPSLNELSEADRAARHFHTNHVSIEITDEDALHSLPDIIRHQDEPIADPVCVPLYHLAKRTKENGVTVVQIGEGSDELFFGYSAYVQVLAAARRLWRLQRLVPHIALTTGTRVLEHMRPGVRAEFARESVDHGVPAPHGIAGMAEVEKLPLLSGWEANGWTPSLEYLRELVGSAEDAEGLSDVALAHETLLRLPELLLMRVDKMTMAASVEGRAPFLDRDLVEYVARLPLSVRYAGDVTKAPLKAAMRGLVPDEVLDRPKKGFGAPVWRWSTSLQSLARAALLRESMAEYLAPAAVRTLLEEAPTRRQGFHVWILLNFALWHYQFVEGGDLDEMVDVAGHTTSV
jgi:asparagine synthase (glutamine-hydrolysing)